MECPQVSVKWREHLRRVVIVRAARAGSRLNTGQTPSVA